MRAMWGAGNGVRRQTMSRKRKCRYTPEELALHKEAVRLRNMTDKQLVGAAYSHGFAPGVCPAFSFLAYKNPMPYYL